MKQNSLDDVGDVISSRLSFPLSWFDRLLMRFFCSGPLGDW